jgi:uncharacterized RDD family membrane protein YckC
MTKTPEITLYPASRLRILTAYLSDALLALAGSLGINRFVSTDSEVAEALLFIVSVISISALQSLLLSQRGARTVGRRLTGLIVVSADGQTLSVTRRWLRFPLACLSWGLGGLGILWVLVDPLHRSWHDIATGTVEVPRVIKVKSPVNQS